MSNEREKLAREWAKDCQGEGKLPAYGIAAQAAAEHIMATTTEPTMADVEWDDKHFLAGATLDTEESAEEMVMCGFTRDGEIYVVQPNPGRGKRGYWTMPGDLTPNGKKYELVEVGEHRDYSTKTMDEYTLSERTDMVGMWAGYNRHRLGGKPTDFVIITGEENEAGRVPCYNPGAPAAHDWAADVWMLTPRFDIPRAWGTDGNPELHEATVPEEPAHPETLTTVEDYANAPEDTVVDIFGTVAIRQKYGWVVTGYRYKLDNDEMVQQGEGVVVRWGE